MWYYCLELQNCGWCTFSEDVIESCPVCFTVVIAYKDRQAADAAFLQEAKWNQDLTWPFEDP